jgi:hypothetical protein
MREGRIELLEAVSRRPFQATGSEPNTREDVAWPMF